MRSTSLILRISLALAAIVLMGTSTMLVSYWISEYATTDSLAINLAGSLRMQTYKLGIIELQTAPHSAEFTQALAAIDSTWQHPALAIYHEQKPALTQLYHQAYTHWTNQLKPELVQARNQNYNNLMPQLAHQVALIDDFVRAIQQDAEQKIRRFRLVQIIALFSTLLVSALVIYWLKVKVEHPLSILTRAAKKITQGDFSSKIMVNSRDELSLLASSFNTMSAAIGSMYDDLEQQIAAKTQELTQSNAALQFLYDTAKFIIEHNPEGIQYDHIISRLSAITGIANIELCLMTQQGNSPYVQITPSALADQQACDKANCHNCINSRGQVENTSQFTIYRFQLQRDQLHYGVIVCRLPSSTQMTPWQEQLIQSATDQIALGLSLKQQEDQSRRVAVLQERNAIARELHDSLAQALSYLKIQVTRLNNAINREDKTTMADVADELREGLNNAYRQLRELLTTFRLKIDGSGLRSALEFSVQQLREQNKMNISLDYQLDNLPLSPNEEIHLLQIVREASQNAIHHSRGQNLSIQLQVDPQQNIALAIEDDGVGIGANPERLNHYGLAIMNERGKHLGGDLQVRQREGGGTGVYFAFTPEFIVQRQKSTSSLIAAVEDTSR